MLALRDKENLVHNQQAAAAAKPANQGARTVPPKTPGVKAPKTPFKVALNDENGFNTMGKGKTVLRMGGGRNENLDTQARKGLGDKNNFITPLAPRTRAPLGEKTTNAKGKALQTPGASHAQEDLARSKQRSTARKGQPRLSHVEPVKLDLLDDSGPDERDVEYAPPPVKDLLDVPDDIPNDLNLSMFKSGRPLTEGCLQYYLEQPGPDGLSHLERKQRREQRHYDRIDREANARIERDLAISAVSCLHDPDCPGDVCKDYPEIKREAEQKFRKILKEIEEEARKDGISKIQTNNVPAESKTNAGRSTSTKVTSATTGAAKGPLGTLNARRAAQALGMKPERSQPLMTARVASAGSGRNLQQAAPRPLPVRPRPLVSSAKVPANAARKAQSTTSFAAPAPPATNPSSMRHAASTALSKTTIGYSKARRVASTSSVRKPGAVAVNRISERTLPAAEQDEISPFEREVEEDLAAKLAAIPDWLDEEATKDFELQLGF